MKQILCIVAVVVCLHSESLHFFNRNIPQAAHVKMMSLQQKKLQVVAFSLNGWIIVTQDNEVFFENIPYDCEQQINQCSEKIRDIVFYPQDDGWVIITDTHFYSNNIPVACREQLSRLFSQSKSVHITFTRRGGWLVHNEKSFASHDFPEDCLQVVLNFQQGFRQPHHVVFFDEGWLVLAEDLYFASNIPQECYEQLQIFHQQGRLIHRVVSTMENGWSMVANTTSPKKDLHPSRQLENRANIWRQMTDRNVRGLSIAVIVDNKIDWVCNYGVGDLATRRAVTNDTIFQAASISKTFCALSVLYLVKHKQLSLDKNIGTYISSRFVSHRKCVKKSSVNLRQILGHRSGIIGRGTTYPLDRCSGFNSDGGGFAGYQRNSSIPTIDSILLGHPNCNSPRVEFSYNANEVFSYSGAGYVVIQKIIENVTGMPYALWTKERLLFELGMNSSSFAIDIHQQFSEARIASGYDFYGNEIDGKRRVYPESTAAGLYTTTTDLAKMVIAINQKGRVGQEQLLNAQDVETMLQENLGIFTSGNANYLSFSHSGSNAGFKSLYYGFPYRKGGIVILSNSDGAADWLQELANAIMSIYHWK